MLFKMELRNFEFRNGRPMDFGVAHWTPPLSALQVFEHEVASIENRLGSKAIVSLTDHDTIEANTLLHVLDPLKELPISLEWTVPFGGGMFHVGAHNLPVESSNEIMAALAQYTALPRESDLDGLFSMLSASPSTLVVLNHPMWDITFVGTQMHVSLLETLVARHGQHIHALEVNGYRAWHENERTIQFADTHGFPVVSGGDRHGCAPNSPLNLTNAETFAEFAAEIREDKRSEVLLMPEYKERLGLRMLESMGDILRYYPQFAKGRQRWTDRIFIHQQDGVTRPLSQIWPNGGPGWVHFATWMMRLLGSRRFRPALRLALAREGVTL